MDLLTEDRISDAFGKYKNNPILSKDIFDAIVQGSADIAGNHKYLDWIVSRWVKMREENPETVTSSKESAEEVIAAVETFDKVRNILDIKNLYDYESINHLFDVLRATQTRQRREVSSREDTKKVFENDQYVIMVPETNEASCYYGAGTKWCTAQSNTGSHFNNYKKSGELYYIIDKTKPTSDPTYKVALNKKLSGEEDFWDAVDKMITDTNVIDSIVHDGVLMKSVRDHFKGVHGERAAAAEKERVQREAERAVEQEERRQREVERQRRLNAEAQLRKDINEWEDYDLAHALKEYLIDEDEWEGDKKVDIEYDIDQMRDAMENDPEVLQDPSGERAQDYGEDLDNLQEDLENAESVYDLIPTGYDTDEYAEFEYGGAEYLIATDEGADNYAYERVDNLIDDIGFDGFNPGFMESHIDGDEVANYFEDWFWDDVNESPEEYLDDSNDRELTREGKDRIESLKEEIGEHQEQLEETEDTTEEEELLGMIEELEETIEDIEGDDDYYEYTEEAKENYVESRKEEVKDNPLAWLSDYSVENIDQFIDREEFIDDVISEDGRGHTISSYDGLEGEVTYDNEYYYIYRMN